MNIKKGFKKGRRIMDNLVEISTGIRNSFYENKVVLAAFLGESLVYDNVKGDILIKELMKENSVKDCKMYRRLDGIKKS